MSDQSSVTRYWVDAAEYERQAEALAIVQQDNFRLAKDVLRYETAAGHWRGEYDRVMQQLATCQADNAALVEAWSKSWDCSRDPGHNIMNDALAQPHPGTALLDELTRLRAENQELKRQRNGSGSNHYT